MKDKKELPVTSPRQQNTTRSWLSVPLDIQSVSRQSSDAASTSPRSPLSGSPQKLSFLLGLGNNIESLPKPKQRKNSITKRLFPGKQKESSSNLANIGQGITIGFTPAEIKQLNKFLQFRLPIDVQNEKEEEDAIFTLDLETLTAESVLHKRFARRVSTSLYKQEDIDELFNIDDLHTAISEVAQSSPVKPVHKDSESKDCTASAQQHKRHFSGYDSNNYDDMLETMKKLFILAIKRGIYESILCTFIMRDVYSLMQQLKAVTTIEANASTNASIKTKIVQLTSLIYQYFIVPGCPFPVNFPAEALANIRRQWQNALYPESLNPEIPPLEIMLDALNGLTTETRINKEISELNSESNQAIVITDAPRFLTNDEKKALYSLFDELTYTGCPRHCPPLFSNLESLLELKGEQFSLRYR